VDEQGRPLAADSIETESFVTAFPQGADPRRLASPVVVVRVDPRQLRLPRGRQDWAPGGLLAFSKICTHAGCAISLYRAPLFQPTSPGPALVCPCHYSTFDVLRGALPVFGPAVRSLPQLPVALVNGNLVAAGGYSGPVGPSWWGVRRT
jgi:ubiquinol-cytochrome c reductase iron-sulfur subunit